jgi:hypothetical protein
MLPTLIFLLVVPVFTVPVAFVVRPVMYLGANGRVAEYSQHHNG